MTVRPTFVFAFFGPKPPQNPKNTTNFHKTTFLSLDTECLVNVSSRSKWKNMVNKAINLTVETKWREDISSRSSLKYINPESVKVGKAHHIWSSVHNSLHDSRRAQLKFRILTGTYTLQSNRAVFNQFAVDPTWKLFDKSSESFHNQTLKNVQSAKYLGITISDNMDWDQLISEISSKANKTLGFLRMNLAAKFAPKSTKEVAYKTLVRPKLEYAAPIWSPYSKFLINQVEKVQRTAARWTCRRWRNTSSISESARCLMSLSGHLLRPVGIGPPCFSFIRYILVRCLWKKTSTWPLLTVWNHHAITQCPILKIPDIQWCPEELIFSPNYSAVEYNNPPWVSM